MHTPEKYRRFFEHPFINQAAGEFLFEKRHIDPRVVRWCRLTSWKNWLQIPYYDIEGHLTGVQWRNLACLEGTTAKRSVTGGEALGLRLEAATLSNPVRSAGVTKQESESGWKPVPRFKFPYGSQCHIYNLPVLKLLKPGEDLWIAEGCSDCWSLLSSGHKAIAIPSATLLKPKDLEVLSTLNSQHSTLITHHSTNGSTGSSTTSPSTSWASNPKAPPNGFTSAARWTRARTANASSGRLSRSSSLSRKTGAFSLCLIS